MPEIVNTDQGSQFTATEFTEAVLGQGCQLSMDGRGPWRNNVFVERLWPTVKYERVYLKAYDSVNAARTDIAQYIGSNSAQRAHSSLGDKIPQKYYAANLPVLKLAAKDASPRCAPSCPPRRSAGTSQALPARRRGQLCTAPNPHAVH